MYRYGLSTAYERFGIMEFDRDMNIISVEEKPANPKSNYCITGLYFYPAGVSNKAKEVKPSVRGELKITTLNDLYLQEKKVEGTDSGTRIRLA